MGLTLASEPTLIGREAELEVFESLFARRPMPGAALVVHGEPGIGKTALLDWLVARASGLKMMGLRATGIESESHLPFAGLHQLLRPVLQHAEALARPQRTALLTAFGRENGETPEIFLVALAALELVTEAAARRTVLVTADDVQWLDAPTAEVLAFMGRRLEGDEVTLVATLRDGYDSPLLEADLPTLALEGLDEKSSATLLDQAGDRLPPGARAQVLEQACGNPLALLELAAGARDTGFDTRYGGGSRLPLTARLERAFAAREAALSERPRALLLVAAAADGEVAIADAVAAARELAGEPIDDDDVLPAAAARLIYVQDGTVRFRHPLVRSGVYQAAEPSRRRAAHAALAHTLTRDPDRSAWHRAAATLGRDETVARDLEAAADRAHRRGAIAVAVRALERASNLTPDPGNEARLLLAAAELAFQLGRPELVEGLLGSVSAAALDRVSSARMTLIRESFHDGQPGDASTALALVEHADDMRVHGQLDIAVAFLRGAALRTWWADPGAAVRARVVAAAERFTDHALDPRVIHAMAFAGPFERGHEVIARIEATSHLAVEPADAHLLGLAAHAAGHNELALRVLTPVLAELRTQGRFAVLAQLLGVVTWSAIALGDWDTASAAAAEGIRLARETSQHTWGAGTLAGAAFVDGIRGRAGAARAAIAQTEAVAVPGRLQAQLCVAQVARGATELSVGDHAEAFAHLRRVFDPDDLAFHHVDRLVGISYFAEAAAHSDNSDEARGVLEDLQRLGEATPSPALHLGIAHARAFLATDEDKERMLREALAVAQPSFLRARLQLEYGSWLRRHRRAVESRDLLRAAHEVFAAVHAAPWEERAQRELRASGERPRGRAPETRDKLTPQELQIARLAAEGGSNHEIGQQLYLSHRTVASHLYRLFPKLGITSRGQLTEALTLRGDGDMRAKR